MNRISKLRLVMAAVGLVLLAGMAGRADARTADPSGVVNVNTATEAQLTLLPGVGPSKARAILEYRQKSRFKSTGDLVKVKGIGRKLLDRIEPYVRVDGQTTIRAPKKKSRRRSRK